MSDLNTSNGLWKQLDNKNKQPYTPITDNGILKAMQELGRDDDAKHLMYQVDARFDGEKREKLRQLVYSHVQENIDLVKEILAITPAVRPVENPRKLVVMTGTAGMEMINQSIKDYGKQ